MNNQNSPKSFTDISLSTAQLIEIRDQMVAGIAQGLALPNQTVKALPAFTRLPETLHDGEVVVLDAGGTNVRAAQIAFAQNEVRYVQDKQRDESLMSQAQEVGAISSEVFFQRQADLVHQVCQQPEFDLGYCFSYPSTNTPDGDAQLVTWTKGIVVENVIGRSLREMIGKAIANNNQTAHKIPVLNDTVTTLLAGAWLTDCDQYIGLIAGTGLNAAAFYPVSQITKLTDDEKKGWKDTDLMAVNLEIGNFHPKFLSTFDDTLNALRVHDNPNKQRLEKAASGRYIAPIIGQMVGREVCLNLPAEYAFDPEDIYSHAGMVAKLRDYPDATIAQAAHALLERSADLTAVILAAIIMGQNADSTERRAVTTGILVEGTLFWQTEGYKEHVAEQLQQLIPPHITPQFLHNDLDVQTNFIGLGYATLAMNSSS
jgi:hexokinase